MIFPLKVNLFKQKSELMIRKNVLKKLVIEYRKNTKIVLEC